VTKPKGGQFVLHVKALHGNPYDGHTLGSAVADVTRNTGFIDELNRVNHLVPAFDSDEHFFGVLCPGRELRGSVVLFQVAAYGSLEVSDASQHTELEALLDENGEEAH
jgi:hypothetical protein